MKEKIEEIFKKVKDDPKFMENFTKNPVSAVEGVIGVDLPDDQINGVIDGVKAKLAADQGKDLLGKVSGIFGK